MQRPCNNPPVQVTDVLLRAWSLRLRVALALVQVSVVLAWLTAVFAWLLCVQPIGKTT